MSGYDDISAPAAADPYDAVSAPTTAKTQRPTWLSGRSRAADSDPFLGSGKADPKNKVWELPAIDQVNLSRADNLRERQLYLEHRYGKDALSTEKTPSGKEVLYVTANGRKMRASSGLLESIAGDSPTMAAMAVGAAKGASLGAEAGPWTALAGALGGAAIGGIFGKTLDEGRKALAGEYSKTPEEYLKAVAGAGAAGAAGEGAGRVIGAAASRLTRGPLPNWVTDTTPESRAMTERALAGGAKPPSSSTMPGARKIQRIETLASKISGPPKAQQKANVDYLNNRMGAILKASGVPETHVAAALRELDDPTAAATTTQVGQDLQQGVRAHVASLEQGVKETTDAADKIINQKLGSLEAMSRRHPAGGLGADVANEIKEARGVFSTAAGKLYKQVDRLSGGQPLVPTRFMKQEAARIVALLPESDATRPILKSIAEYPEKVTFEQAQRARTQLHGLMEAQDLTPNATKGEYRRVALAVDRAFDLAARDPAAAPAARMLQSADQFYASGIKKFQDVTINRLVQAMRAGLPPDPAIVAKAIVQPGQEARVKEIRSLVGEKVWGRVAAQDWANMLREATSADGRVSGQRLLGELNRRQTLNPTVYGAKTASDIRQVAETLAARDGYITPDALQPGLLKDTLAAVRTKETQLDKFMKENYLASIADPKRTPEDAYRWLTQPGQEARLAEAVKFYGAASPQIQAVQQQALKTLLTGTTSRALKGEGSKALTNALAQYTEKQQKLLFPRGLDEDLRLLGKEAEFLFPNAADQAMAGFTAGNILEMPWYKRYYHQIVGGGWRMIVQHPAVIRRLALGFRGDSKVRAATRATMQQMFYASALETEQD